ncbi:UNVERIFIED_CONTAM: hypothetical protein K2H54_061512 [Gekko kuhli]
MEGQSLAGSPTSECLDLGGGLPHILQVETVREFLAGTVPQPIKKEPAEGLRPYGEVQQLGFPKMTQFPHSGWGDPLLPPPWPEDDSKEFQASFMAVAGITQWPRGQFVAQIPPELSEENQEAYEPSASSIKVKEEMSEEERQGPLEYMAVNSPKSEDDPPDSMNMQFSVEAKHEASLLGKEQVQRNEETITSPEQADFSAASLGGTEGTFFQELEEKELPISHEELESQQENYPGKATDVCDEPNLGFDGTAFQDGICRLEGQKSAISASQNSPPSFDLTENQETQLAEKGHQCYFSLAEWGWPAHEVLTL